MPWGSDTHDVLELGAPVLTIGQWLVCRRCASLKEEDFFDTHSSSLRLVVKKDPPHAQPLSASKFGLFSYFTIELAETRERYLSS